MAQATAQEIANHEEDAQRGRFLTFSIDREVYGIHIGYVIEIVGIQPITAVPELPDYIRGVINLRGKIIPVMDVRLRLKKPLREYDGRTCIIVIDTKDISIGLIVDSVSEVLSIPEEDIVPLPEINHSGRGYLKAIGKTEDGMRLLLDCKKLLNEEELEALDTANEPFAHQIQSEGFAAEADGVRGPAEKSAEAAKTTAALTESDPGAVATGRTPAIR